MLCHLRSFTAKRKPQGPEAAPTPPPLHPSTPPPLHPSTPPPLHPSTPPPLHPPPSPPHPHPRRYFAKIYNRTTVAKGEAFPLSGCVFGCMVGSDPYSGLTHEVSVAFGWSGKCFSEERDANNVPKRFGSFLNVRRGCWW
jgi:hypothetical protein